MELRRMMQKKETMKRTRVSTIDISLQRALGDVDVGLLGNGIHGVCTAATDGFTGVAVTTRRWSAPIGSAQKEDQKKSGRV